LPPHQEEDIVSLVLRVAILLCVLSAPGVASAAEPARTSFTVEFSNIVTGICEFPVTVDSTLVGTQTNFFDNNGTQTSSHFAITETDVFTANGNTLIGLPYHTSLRAVLDPSDPNIQLSAVATGVQARIPLPDGSTFLSAGRIDFVGHPGEPFILTPDRGRAGNLAGFCAALAS
jgi:hypothetical protein